MHTILFADIQTQCSPDMVAHPFCDNSTSKANTSVKLLNFIKTVTNIDTDFTY